MDAVRDALRSGLGSRRTLRGLSCTNGSRERLLGDPSQLLDEALSRGSRWQWITPFFWQEQPLVDDVAELRVHLLLIFAMATRTDNTWTLPDKALIFV